MAKDYIMYQQQQKIVGRKLISGTNFSHKSFSSKYRKILRKYPLYLPKQLPASAPMDQYLILSLLKAVEMESQELISRPIFASLKGCHRCLLFCLLYLPGRNNQNKVKERVWNLPQELLVWIDGQ